MFFEENSEVFCLVHHKNIRFVIYYTRARDNYATKIRDHLTYRTFCLCM